MPSATQRGVHTAAHDMEVSPSTFKEKRIGQRRYAAPERMTVKTSQALSRRLMVKKPFSIVCSAARRWRPSIRWWKTKGGRPGAKTRVREKSVRTGVFVGYRGCHLRGTKAIESLRRVPRLCEKLGEFGGGGGMSSRHLGLGHVWGAGGQVSTDWGDLTSQGGAEGTRRSHGRIQQLDLRLPFPPSSVGPSEPARP